MKIHTHSKAEARRDAALSSEIIEAPLPSLLVLCPYIYTIALFIPSASSRSHSILFLPSYPYASRVEVHTQCFVSAGWLWLWFCLAARSYIIDPLSLSPPYERPVQ